MQYEAGDVARWQRCRKLFSALVQRVQQQAFDDAYLLMLIEFKAVASDAVEPALFYALYAWAHGNAAVAREYAERAYHARKINRTLWLLLRDIYLRGGDSTRALVFAGFASAFYKEPLTLSLPRTELLAALPQLSLSLNYSAEYPPTLTSYMELQDSGELTSRAVVNVGTFLPQAQERLPWRYWVGVFTEQEMLDYKGALLAAIKDNAQMARLCSGDLTFDIMRAQAGETAYAVTASAAEPVIVPLAGTAEEQRVYFDSAGAPPYDSRLGKWEFNYYRLTAPTHIHADTPFVLGRPIQLGHSPRRRKVVLSILLDAFCWQAVKERDYDLVPHLMAFFQQGIIFNDHHSVGEYTLPSVPTIETGMYPQHSQIFNKHATCWLNAGYTTLTEQLHGLGYYCVNTMGCGEGLYTGVARGFDRLVTNAYALHTYVGVERTLRQLMAFDECDQYLLLHTMDAHPWTQNVSSLPFATQTHSTIAERSLHEEKACASVRLPNRPVYLRWNAQAIRDIDRSLAQLFAYLEAHYRPEEYLVMLCSDHGVPIYDAETNVLSPHMNGAAFMLRGGGVPARGCVDELTSNIDIYPALGKLLGFPVPETVDGCLPHALGGPGRDCAISTSIYPGQTFKLCLRTQTRACYLEAQELTDEDGRCDLRGAAIGVYDRATGQRLPDSEVTPFLPRIEAFTRHIDSHGCQWPDMRAGREYWYDKREDRTQVKLPETEA